MTKKQDKLARKAFEKQKVICAARIQEIINNLKAGKPVAQAVGEVMFKV